MMKLKDNLLLAPVVLIVHFTDSTSDKVQKMLQQSPFKHKVIHLSLNLNSASYWNSHHWSSISKWDLWPGILLTPSLAGSKITSWISWWLQILQRLFSTWTLSHTVPLRLLKVRSSILSQPRLLRRRSWRPLRGSITTTVSCFLSRTEISCMSILRNIRVLPKLPKSLKKHLRLKSATAFC